MFWENFRALCFQKNTTPSRVCLDLGIAKSAPNRWKNGSIPNGSTINKIAEYFGVTTDYFFSAHEESKTDLDAYLEEIRTRTEIRTLFSLAKNASREDVERAIAIIKALKETNKDG